MKRNNILVVGGAGFVGRPLVKELANKGLSVSIVDNEFIKPAEAPHGFKTHYKCDVRNLGLLANILKEEEPEVIYWLAAKQGYDDNFALFGSINVGAVYSLFNALPSCSVRKIVLASSQAVYSPGSFVTEDHPKNPPSVYGLTKLQQEQAFMHLCSKLGIEFTALRYSIILGGGQSMQSTESGLLRNWVRQWRSDEPPLVYGSGNQSRDFIHIDDVTRANMLALEYGGPAGVYNVAGFAATVWEMASHFQDETGCSTPIITNKEVRPGGEYTLTSSGEKIFQELSFLPTIKPKEQIWDFIQFIDRSKK
jgi:UDP-glucose 4-epimerase